MSIEALRLPLVTISRNLGNAAISNPENGVRSRIRQTTSKGTRPSTSAGPPIVSRNTVISASSRSQLARPSATP